MVKSDDVDTLQDEFATLPADTPRNLMHEIGDLARPDVKNHKALNRNMATLCTHVTGSPTCRDLTWLDEEEKIVAWFAACKNKAGSKRTYSDALVCLYLSYEDADGARQARYFALHRGNCCGAIADQLSGEASEAQIANTPTLAEIDDAFEKADLQGRALIALARTFQGRNQNYCLRLLTRINGDMISSVTGAIPAEELHADGYPLDCNAYIFNMDGGPDQYFQGKFKTVETVGRKVGDVPVETALAVKAWVTSDLHEGAADSASTGFLFLDTKGKPVRCGVDAPSDTVAGLCKRIFQATVQKAVTPGLLRRAFGNSPAHRASFAMLASTADVQNHTVAQQTTSGNYTGKGNVC